MGEATHPASPRSAQDSRWVTGAAGVWAAPHCIKATSLFQILLCGAAQLLQMWQEHGERQVDMAMAGGRLFHCPFGPKFFWLVLSVWIHTAHQRQNPHCTVSTRLLPLTCQARRSCLGPWKCWTLRMGQANQVVLPVWRHSPRKYRGMKIYRYLYTAVSEHCSLGWGSWTLIRKRCLLEFQPLPTCPVCPTKPLRAAHPIWERCRPL